MWMTFSHYGKGGTQKLGLPEPILESTNQMKFGAGNDASNSTHQAKIQVITFSIFRDMTSQSYLPRESGKIRRKSYDMPKNVFLRPNQYALHNSLTTKKLKIN